MRAESLVFYRRYFVCVHLFGLFRSGKEGACLFDEGCRVFVARGEMPYQQPAGLGFRGGFCGLQGSGVPCLPGERPFRVGKGGLVVEQVYTMDDVRHFARNHRIAAICVTARCIGEIGQFAVGYRVAVRSGNVFAALGGGYLCDTETVAFDGLLVYVELRPLFSEKISCCRNTVSQRDAPYLHDTVFEYRQVFSGIHLAIDYLEGQVRVEVAVMVLQNLTQRSRREDRERCPPSHESHGRYEREKSVDVVAVKVRQENRV